MFLKVISEQIHQYFNLYGQKAEEYWNIIIFTHL